jgi:hypothetical protein
MSDKGRLPISLGRPEVRPEAPSVMESERRKEIMLPLQDLRAKLLAQRRDLFRQVAQTEEDLLWLETDVEREAIE